jgi:hypothetical protein
MAGGEARHGDRFHNRDHDRFRHFFLSAPYDDYGYACDYTYPRTYAPGYYNYNGCVAPYQGWPSYD